MCFKGDTRKLKVKTKQDIKDIEKNGRKERSWIGLCLAPVLISVCLAWVPLPGAKAPVSITFRLIGTNFLDYIKVAVLPGMQVFFLDAKR